MAAAVLLQFLCGLHLWLAGTVQLQPAALQHCSSSTDKQGLVPSLLVAFFFCLFRDIDIAFIDKVSLLLSIICFFSCLYFLHLSLLGGGKPCTLKGPVWEDGFWMRTNASWSLLS